MGIPAFLAIAKLILVLATIIMIHELGHLAVAKLNGIAAPAFSIGFGKVLFKRKWGETEYRFSAIPLGGYVQMAGHGSCESGDGDIPKNRLFSSKRPIEKLSVVLAGPLANIAFALAMCIAMAFWAGIAIVPPVVGNVIHGSGAEAAGILPGDIIVAVNGSPVSDFTDIPGKITGPEKTAEISFRRPGLGISTLIIPLTETERTDIFGDTEKVMTIGIYADTTNIRMERPGMAGGLAAGWRSFNVILSVSTKAMVRLLTGRLSLTHLSGPIGIGSAIYEQQEVEDSTLSTILSLLAVLSINIGMLNLLPLPVLDGGHVVIHAFELFGMNIPEKIIKTGTYAGMALIVSLMVMTTGLDLAKLLGILP